MIQKSSTVPHEEKTDAVWFGKLTSKKHRLQSDVNSSLLLNYQSMFTMFSIMPHIYGTLHCRMYAAISIVRYGSHTPPNTRDLQSRIKFR